MYERVIISCVPASLMQLCAAQICKRYYVQLSEVIVSAFAEWFLEHNLPPVHAKISSESDDEAIQHLSLIMFSQMTWFVTKGGKKEPKQRRHVYSLCDSLIWASLKVCHICNQILGSGSWHWHWWVHVGGEIKNYSLNLQLEKKTCYTEIEKKLNILKRIRKWQQFCLGAFLTEWSHPTWMAAAVSADRAL